MHSDHECRRVLHGRQSLQRSATAADLILAWVSAVDDRAHAGGVLLTRTCTTIHGVSVKVGELRKR
jgi:hypothetical protein